MKFYEFCAMKLSAIRNCQKSGNTEWLEKHTEDLENACKQYLPSGSGFDCGTEFDLHESNPDECLVFYFDWHRMDEHGCYDGWQTFRVNVTPAFHGVNIDIQEQCENPEKADEYFYDVFYSLADVEVK